MPLLYQHRREVLALWSVQTKRLHLYQDMQEILKQAFIRHAKQHRPNQPDNARQYQATIYASLAMANTRYWLEQEKQPKIEDTFGLLQELFELMKVCSFTDRRFYNTNKPPLNTPRLMIKIHHFGRVGTLALLL